MVNRLVRKPTVMTGTLVLVVGMYGCNSTSTGGGGGDGNGNGNTPCTDLTYANFAAGFMTAYCTDCHSSALSGVDRQGAPDGFDYDTLEGVKAQLERIRVRAVEAVQDGDVSPMPPPTADAFPTAAELEQLAEWIDCDAPA